MKESGFHTDIQYEVETRQAILWKLGKPICDELNDTKIERPKREKCLEQLGLTTAQMEQKLHIDEETPYFFEHLSRRAINRDVSLFLQTGGWVSNWNENW